MKRLMMLMLLVLLAPGCSSGGALSSVAAGAIGLIGGAGVGLTEDKVAARADWIGKRRDLVAVKRGAMLGHAQMKLTTGDYRCFLQIMGDVLAFHDEEKPVFLVEKLIKKKAAPAEGPTPQRLDCLPPVKAAPPNAGSEAATKPF